MFGIKKKLSSLLPSEARAHLQNALTVEWDDGNKTVLVDIPDGQNDDVELEGIMGNGRGRGRSNSGAGYGRLADDDDNKYTRAPRGASRGQSYSSYDRDAASASGSGSSQGYNSNSNIYANSSYTSSKPSSSNQHSHQKTLPPLPSRSTLQAGRETYVSRVSTSNPFEEDADYPSPVPSTSTYASSGPGASPFSRPEAQFGMQSHFGAELSVPNGSVGSGGSGSNGRKVGNPWASFRADEVDMLGEEETGRDGRDQNPFR